MFTAIFSLHPDGIVEIVDWFGHFRAIAAGEGSAWTGVEDHAQRPPSRFMFTGVRGCKIPVGCKVIKKGQRAHPSLNGRSEEGHSWHDLCLDRTGQGSRRRGGDILQSVSGQPRNLENTA